MEAAIFDLDGTLIDLFEVHYKAFHDAVKEASQLEFTREDLVAGYGLTTEEIAGMFFKKHGVSGVDLKKLTEAREKTVSQHLTEMRVLPGAVKLLKKLKNSGIKIAVGTSSRKPMTLKVLSASGLSEYFDAVSTISDASNGKPAPDIFFNAAKMLNVPPEKCVVFEDSPYGIKAAKKAGMKSCAVLYASRRNRKELEKEKPDTLVNSLEELTEKIYGVNS